MKVAGIRWDAGDGFCYRVCPNGEIERGGVEGDVRAWGGCVLDPLAGLEALFEYLGTTDLERIRKALAVLDDRKRMEADAIAEADRYEAALLAIGKEVIT